MTYLLAAVTLALAVAVAAAVTVVTLACHEEERRRSLRGPAPGPVTRLARRLLAMPDAPVIVADGGRRGHGPRAPAREPVTAGHAPGAQDPPAMARRA